MLVLTTSNFQGATIRPACLQKNFHGTRTIHLDIFRGHEALWADDDTITSRGRFKPIRIGKTLVVNYNVHYACSKTK